MSVDQSLRAKVFFYIGASGVKAIVIGAGEVGFNLAQNLVKEHVEVVIVDEREEVISRVMEEMDVHTLKASGTNLATLSAVGIRDADMLLAVTDMDEKNILACLIAKECGVPITVARVREQDFSTKDFSISLEKMGVDHIINPNRLAAQVIAQLAKVPSMIDWHEFAEGKMSLMGFLVNAEAPIAYKMLKDIPSIPSFRVAAIFRDDTLIIPSGIDQIMPDDKLFVITKKESLKKAFRLFSKDKADESRKIAIIGGGRVGFSIAQQLEEENLSVIIIERDLKRCNYLSEHLKKTLVLNGDAKDQKLLTQEGIWNTHTFVSVTNATEINLFAALLAKQHDVPKSICLITDAEFVPLASSLGIDIPLNAHKLTADFILKLIRKSKTLSLATLLEDRAETMEIAAAATSKCVGHSLKKLKVPRGSIIGAIVRGEKVIIPGGEDSILPGDRVIVFTLPASRKKVEALFRT
jgi:trk system potassium uptake protein TrkA